MTDVIKIERAGTAYWNDAAMAHDTIEEQARSSDGVVYYFESPELEPSNQQIAVLRRIRASGTTVIDGRTAPSEWGVLEWFELEESPFVMRFAVVPDQPILFAAARDKGRDPETWIVPADAALRTEVTSHLDFLIRANRVVETRPNEPQKAFAEDVRNKRATHVRISYGGNRRWAGYFPKELLPQSVAALKAGCIQYGLESFTADAQRIDASTARRAFQNKNS